MPETPVQEAPPPSSPPEEEEPLGRRLRRLVIGAPRNLEDRTLFHRLALVPLLAWVGLGADGLSSSAYGPDEAFRTLGGHTFLALPLAFLMAGTVFLISAAYSRIIEQFPHGGGGYVVATKLLGERAGVVSGCALLIDYVLTITVSVAAAGDALFSFLPPHAQSLKLPVEVLLLAGLTTLNLRGVRESVLTLAPIFLLFVATHVVLILGGIVAHAPAFPATARSLAGGCREGLSTLGAGGVLLLLLRAYSLGGGTYTGIEAVSNGLPLMRRPRARTAKRTMIYMASSLAFTATGLLLCYLLWNVAPVPGKTMNAVLVERLAAPLPGGGVLVVLTLLSEASLLVVAAQAGFLDGPRVLANMAVDSWMPHRFSALSDRLTTQNGVLLMGGASLAALFYTGGAVGHLVVMYSINVFLTFSLSMLGMTLWRLRNRRRDVQWKRRAALFGVGFALCATILVSTVVLKFRAGGWVTLLLTGSVVSLCFLIRRHYRVVAAKLARLYADLGTLPLVPAEKPGALDPSAPTAAVLVGSYGGLGIHTTLTTSRTSSSSPSA